jgi:outer membrane protein assembly factor BamE
MFAQVHCSARLGLFVLLGASLAACGSLDGATDRLASVVTPYKIDVVQGNFVSREQVQALQPGMGRQQVRDILGTPLITSLFHADRWEYVFTLKRPGTPAQTRKLTVYFQGDTFERFEGDEMPSESEFVATLEKSKPQRAVPVLEATEAQLARFPAPVPKPQAAPALPESAPATSYPPLEPPER